MTSDNEYFTTRELADYLRIKERKVYDLAASGDVPCTRATGKLLFPRREVEAWLAGHHSGPTISTALALPGVFLGSHDPLLEWALKESGCGLASYFDGSLDGIERFGAGGGVATSMHLYEPDNNTWNVTTIAEQFEGKPVVLIEFAWRERGLVFDPQRISHRGTSAIESIESLRSLRVVPRQGSAGSQVLLLKLLADHGIGLDEITFVSVAHTETDAVTAVLEGAADVTLGLHGIARRYSLGFTPVIHERFDLLVDRRAWFEPDFQMFVRFCTTPAFAERAEALGGYDISGLGTVCFNG
ncbi:MAG: DNA-binding protein [marine bacterium B5-7]|nr:MAG: DNA-binding protein [marine bacterium B5-7]